MNLKYCLTGILLLFIKTQGQEIKPLSVGDRVPVININTIFNYPALRSNLSAFKDKLVILDFMATNCASCLKVLPRFDSLQKLYGNKLQIFLVTNEKKEKVRKFLQARPGLKLAIIGEDTLLRKYFPHTYISHEVWIKDETVKAITHTEYVTASNIDVLLAKQKVKWPVKNDKEAATSSRRYSIILLYLRTYGLYTLPASQIILETKDTDRFFYTGKGFKTEWKQNNLFSYEMISGETEPSKIRNDLDEYFNLHGRIEKRLTECLVLKRFDSTSAINLPASFDASHFRISINGLIYELNKQGKKPVIDESGFKVKMVINKNISDMSLLREELKKYGLYFISAEREVQTLILTDRNNFLNIKN